MERKYFECRAIKIVVFWLPLDFATLAKTGMLITDDQPDHR
jgi:hypothetical protein